MKALTNKDLKAMYRRINRVYFRNQLLKDMVVVFSDTEDDGVPVYGEFEPPNRIAIANDLKRMYEVVETTLLHECVHASLGEHNHHGMRFQARIVELFNQGAYDGLL